LEFRRVASDLWAGFGQVLSAVSVPAAEAFVVAVAVVDSVQAEAAGFVEEEAVVSVEVVAVVSMEVVAAVSMEVVAAVSMEVAAAVSMEAAIGDWRQRAPKLPLIVM